MAKRILEEVEKARQDRVRDLERLEKEGRRQENDREDDEKSSILKELIAAKGK